MSLRVFRGLVALTCLLACDSKPGAEPQVEATKPATADATPAADDKPAKKDRGDASMSIAGLAWTADSVKARLDAPKLKITASRTDVTEGDVSRQELQLVIDDYKGPGAYETGITSSRFVSVGLDIATAKAAADDDTKTAKVTGDALSQAKHTLLSKAKVTIDSASDTEIVGTFSWVPLPNMQGPELSDGKFRAIVAEKK